MNVVYVALNFDIWKSWIGTFNLRGEDIYDHWRPSRPGCQHPPLWVFKECTRDETIRVYYWLTKEVLAWFHQTITRLNDFDKTKRFAAVLEAAEFYLPFYDRNWAQSQTKPMRLPPSRHITRPIKVKYYPLGTMETDHESLKKAQETVPNACKIGTPEYNRLVSFASNYSSSSGPIVFGRHYPSAIDSTEPPLLKQRKDTPSPLAGKRLRTKPKKKLRDI